MKQHQTKSVLWDDEFKGWLLLQLTKLLLTML